MGKRIRKTFEERCKEVLQYIEDFYFSEGKMPSLQEIAKGLGIKSRGGHLHPIIDYLVDEGRLERDPRIPRGLRLKDRNLFSIPLKGIIAANNRNPEIVLDEDPNATIEILSELIPSRHERSKIYALTVKGNSMKDALIADGDTVLMREGDAYNEGDIVAVWLKNEGAVTLKKIQQGRAGIIKLKPKSHQHHTRVEKQEDIKILGRIMSVIRKYV